MIASKSLRISSWRLTRCASASPLQASEPTDAPEAPDKTPAPEAAATSDAAESKEEEDCGFCTYMRAGPCGEVFTAWEKCVEDHRSRDEDFAKGCVPATRALTECMSEHKDYYELPDQEAPAADAPETAPIAAATPLPTPTRMRRWSPLAATRRRAGRPRRCHVCHPVCPVDAMRA